MAVGMWLIGRDAPEAVLVGLWIAGFGAWWLGVVLGWGRLSRVWMGLIGGWIIGRLGVGASSAWLPWAVAWTTATMRWRRPLYAAAATVTLALTILGENSGLSIATLPTLLLIIGAVGLQPQRKRPYFAVRSTEWTLPGIIALLGVGLAAIQLIPLLFAWRTPLGDVLKGLLAWGAVIGLVPIGHGTDRLMQWALVHLRSPRMYVPAVARWAAAWGLLALLWLLAALLLINQPEIFGLAPATGAPQLADLILSRSLLAHTMQRSADFWVGFGLSVLALTGVLVLAATDLHRRRTELHVSATCTDGTLRPATPLRLPEGTAVYVAFAAPETDEAMTTGEPVTESMPLHGESCQPEEALSLQQRTDIRQSQLTTTPGANPWQLPQRQIAFLLLFAATIGIILFLRLFKLEWLQREIYGDIMIVRNYVTNVLAGHWPTRFDLSAGPLYHYLIAPIVALVGRDYTGLKIASVIVSLGGLAATYALCRELVDDYFALLTTFIAGVSSWLLVFSRLGNSQIISPLLTAAMLWLAARFVKFGRQADLIACAVVSALGLYVYPQLFILPGVAFVVLVLLRWTGFVVPGRMLGLFVVVTLICAIPFIFIVRADPANFTVGYVGSKLKAEGDLPALLAQNTVKALLALHVRGDEIFRSNPPGQPHLDPISGVLFLAGALYWLTDRERRRWAPIWLAPLLLLQVPSIMAVNQPREVPSASRTLGITPIAYMLVASGLWWLIGAIRRRVHRWVAPIAATAILLAAILALNVQRYFRDYLSNLPYGDIPIGRLIADYADSLPDDTHVYMVGCCWIYSIPDRFVDKEVARPQNWHYLEANQLSCTQLQYLKLPAVLIWSFRDALPAPQLASCPHYLPGQLYTYRGKPTFRAAVVRPDLPPQQGSATAAETRQGLEATLIELDGQPVDLIYSKLDMGSPADMFDGNRATLARGLEANPFVLEFVFSKPRPIAGLSADFAHMDFTITARLYGDGDAEGRTYTLEYRDRVPEEPHIEMAFENPPAAVRKLRLEILQLNPPLDVHIHVREIKLK